MSKNKVKIKVDGKIFSFINVNEISLVDELGCEKNEEHRQTCTCFSCLPKHFEPDCEHGHDRNLCRCKEDELCRHCNPIKPKKIEKSDCEHECSCYKCIAKNGVKTSKIDRARDMIGFRMDEDRQEDFETLKEYVEIEYGDMVEIWTFPPKKDELECELPKVKRKPFDAKGFKKAAKAVREFECNCEFGKVKECNSKSHLPDKPKKIEKLGYGTSVEERKCKINELIDDRNNSLRKGLRV